MNDAYPQMEQFRAALRNSLTRDRRQAELLTVAADEPVYTAGDDLDMVYVIEAGEVKLVAASHSGRECLLGIETAGDIVGESVFSGVRQRQETAVAMREVRLLRMPRAHFLERLKGDGLLVAFIGYLCGRLAEQDRRMVSLVTDEGERRLGVALLALARKIGCRDAACNALLRVHVSHEELAAMIGTTRPRVTTFLQKFRRLDLVRAAERQRLIVRECRLAAHLDALDEHL